MTGQVYILNTDVFSATTTLKKGSRVVITDTAPGDVRKIIPPYMLADAEQYVDIMGMDGFVKFVHISKLDCSTQVATTTFVKWRAGMDPTRW